MQSRAEKVEGREAGLEQRTWYDASDPALGPALSTLNFQLHESALALRNRQSVIFESAQ
jgi:hypothetical protein